MIDYKIENIGIGTFDIVLPIEKITNNDDLLFQQVKLILNTYLKEFPYDITMGIPYQQILNKEFDLTTIEKIFFNKISVLFYFKEMKNFTIDIDINRNYNINFTVVSKSATTQDFYLGI